MRVQEIVENKPSKTDCKKPAAKLSASWLASCKSQGFKSRTGGKSHKIGKKRIKVKGRRLKGKKYGGPLPDWS